MFTPKINKAKERSSFILLIGSHKNQNGCVFTIVFLKQIKQVVCL